VTLDNHYSSAHRRIRKKRTASILRSFVLDNQIEVRRASRCYYFLRNAISPLGFVPSSSSLCPDRRPIRHGPVKHQMMFSKSGPCVLECTARRTLRPRDTGGVGVARSKTNRVETSNLISGRSDMTGRCQQTDIGFFGRFWLFLGNCGALVF
jgi:hypothetical protein